MNELSIDEIIDGGDWTLVEGELRCLCLYETIKDGVAFDEDLIKHVQLKKNKKTKNGKQEYLNTAGNFLKNELSNKQRVRVGISDDEWQSWSGMQFHLIEYSNTHNK